MAVTLAVSMLYLHAGLRVPDGFQKVGSKRSPTGVTLERERETERNKEKNECKKWMGR
jgi:hypothetical protein